MMHRSLAVVLLATLPAAGQPCPTPTEPLAETVWALNQSGDAFNFSYAGAQGSQPIQMADPTILKLRDSTGQLWFFVTGTTDFIGSGAELQEIRGTNFAIFRSTDLRHWYRHSWFLDPSLRGVNSWDNRIVRIQTPSGGERFFKHFNAPQLYHPPGNDSIIYMTFTAAELSDPNLDDDEVPDEDRDWNCVSDPREPIEAERDGLSGQQKSCMVAWIEKDHFLTPDAYWISPSYHQSMPALYGYRVNNGGGALVRDGGAAQMSASGVYSAVPTTGRTHESARWKAGQQLCGNAVKVIHGFHWACIGPRTWMSGDPLVFFDHTDNCRPWITWTWAQRSQLDASQNHVAAYPMAAGPHSQNYFVMDALYQNTKFPAAAGRTQPLQLFFAWNNHNAVNGIPNGQIVAGTGNQPAQWVPSDTNKPAGVAEGSDVFFYNGRWYALASRNPFGSPAYQMVYRMTAAGDEQVESLHLPWNLTSPPVNAPEHVLVASDWVLQATGGRNNAARTNYGHGQFFTAYGRPYVIFHKKLDVASGVPRRVFIKELMFDQLTGEIGRLWETHLFPNFNVNTFKAPLVPNVATPPVP